MKGKGRWVVKKFSLFEFNFPEEMGLFVSSGSEEF